MPLFIIVELAFSVLLFLRGHMTHPAGSLLNVGDQLANSDVQRHDGTATSLSELAGTGFLLVFVYRGCWCAFCLRRLAQYRQRDRAFQRADVPVVALSMDEAQASARLKRMLKLPFDLLCDPTGRLVAAWGLTNPRDRYTALPATVLLDRNLQVRWVCQDDGYAAPTVDDVLQCCAAVVRNSKKLSQPKRTLRIPGVVWWLRAALNELRFGRGAARRSSVAQASPN